MKRIVVLFIALLAMGCQDVKYPEKPEDLIPRDKMVDLLTEAYLSHAAKSLNNRVLRENKIRLDSLIYNKYNIDSLQYARSTAYYASDLNQYHQMLKEVETRLKYMKRSNDSTAEKERWDKVRVKEDTAKDRGGLITPKESGMHQDSLE